MRAIALFLATLVTATPVVRPGLGVVLLPPPPERLVSTMMRAAAAIWHSRFAQPALIHIAPRSRYPAWVLVPHAFDWVLPEQLGACVNPSVSESSAAELLTRRIDLLVNLHERPDPPALLAHLRAKTVHLPVPDSLAPTQDQLERGVAVIGEALREGKRVAVHCAAGLGRSGTLIAAYLVSQGSAPDASIALVRAARPGSVENDEQEAAVRQFARQLGSNTPPEPSP